MSRRTSVLFAFAFTAPLTLSALAVCAMPTQPPPSSPQTDNARPNKPIMPKPAVAASKTDKPAKIDRMFQDVPRDDVAYAAVTELQASGVLVGYPEHFFVGKRPLTNYEFAVAVQRMAARMKTLVLAPNGKALQSTFGIPPNLSVAQAQSLLTLWTRFKPELAAIDSNPAEFTQVARTLEIYINTFPGVKAPGVNNPGAGKTENNKAENKEQRYDRTRSGRTAGR